MSRDNDWAASDLNDTVRNLRVLAEAPGDLRFRQSIATSFEKVTDKLQRIEVELAKFRERLLSRTDVTNIARTELQVLENKVDMLNRIVWGLCGAFGIALVGGVVGIAIARIFK